MKIDTVKRIDNNIYAVIYIDFWGVYKKRKAFKSIFNWRWCDNGKEIKYSLSTTIDNLSRDLKIGEIKSL